MDSRNDAVDWLLRHAVDKTAIDTPEKLAQNIDEWVEYVKKWKSSRVQAVNSGLAKLTHDTSVVLKSLPSSDVTTALDQMKFVEAVHKEALITKQDALDKEISASKLIITQLSALDT